jgi:dTDP-4-amino-4,6-dideoxygalactose transaminase
MGARIGERYAGTLGDYGLFSLGPGKPLSTGGGGFVCTDNPEYASMLTAAWAELPAPSGPTSTWAALRLVLFTSAFHPTGWWFATKMGAHRVGENEASWGYALCGLTDAQAAVGQALLPRLDTINEQRREHAFQLAMALHGLKHSLIPGPALSTTAIHGQRTVDASAGEEAELQPIYLRLPLMTAYHGMRERLVDALWNDGISAGRMYGKRLDEYFPQLGGGAYPGADYVARCLLTLPTHHFLNADDVDRIAQIVHRIDST